MPPPLLATKLYVPPPRLEVVLRPRLNVRLNAGLHRMVTLISAPSRVRLHTLRGHTHLVRSLTFSPDGQTLASRSLNETIRLWEVGSGACVDTLRAERPYAGLNITGATGLTEAQRAALKALGAVEDEPLALAGPPQLETPILLAG